MEGHWVEVLQNSGKEPRKKKDAEANPGYPHQETFYRNEVCSLCLEGNTTVSFHDVLVGIGKDDGSMDSGRISCM